MGLGSTAKKVSQIADIAEKLYEQLNAVKDQLESLRTQLEDTNERVVDIDARTRYNEALLEKLAAGQNVDVEALREEVASEISESVIDEEATVDAGDEATQPTD